jgi:hypothetical protein
MLFFYNFLLKSYLRKENICFNWDGKILVNSKELLSLTGKEVFCPKCGTENYFESQEEESKTDFYCKKCNVKMNIFWKTYLDGFMPVEQCEACSELTFKDQIYCVSCGLTKAVIERLDDIESGTYKPKRHKWFILEEVDALDRACFYPSGKRRKLNPHHPKARRNRILTNLGIIIIILIVVAAGFAAVYIPVTLMGS